MRVNERWTHSRAAMRHCSRHCTVTDNWVSTIDFFEMKIGKARNQTRNIPARGLHFDRHRDRIPVVFDQEHDRQPQVRSRIHRFPEFAFAGGAIAERHIRDLVAMKLHVFEFAVIAAHLLPGVRMHHEIATGFSAPDRVKNLRAGA